MKSKNLLSDITREFKKLKTLSFDSITQIDEKQFFLVIEDGNSIAIIIKHLAGNMKSRWTNFLESDGEKPDRNRDEEFEISGEDTKLRILEYFDKGWNLLFGALENLTDNDLSKTVHIRKEPLSVYQALLRQLTHYAYHVGQIVLLAEQIKKDEWKTLSVAKGKSKEFNENPTPYIDK